MYKYLEIKGANFTSSARVISVVVGCDITRASTHIWHVRK